MKADTVGLYVHIPFCLSKCAYCDFCSFTGADNRLLFRYVEALCDEITSYNGKGVKVDTLFFGGGTPSLLSPALFKKIICAVRSSFDISELSEFTVEVNPKTLTRESLESYVSLGVNRISIGLQSIHENELKKLGRIHSCSDFLATYNLCRELGIHNLNVDLMYGLPEQTIHSFAQTLDAVISLDPEHLSVYSLIVEPNTPLSSDIAKYNIPDDDSVCDMYELCCNKLSKSGYKHYEISNFAKPGYECKHNLKYWNTDEYIGVGLSAHSYFENCRFSNSATKDDKARLFDYVNGKFSHKECASVDKNDAVYEYIMLRLRLSDGIILSHFREKFGFDFVEGREEKIQKFVKLGLASLNEHAFYLTERGFFLSSAILVELL